MHHAVFLECIGGPLAGELRSATPRDYSLHVPDDIRAVDDFGDLRFDQPVLLHASLRRAPTIYRRIRGKHDG